MEAAVAAGAAIVGVAIGGLLESIRDRARRREAGHDRLAEAIVAFISAAVTCDDLSWDVWHANHGLEQPSRPPAGGATPALVAAAFQELMPTFYLAILLAPDKLHGQIEEVYEHVKRYSRRLEDSTVSPPEWTKEWRTLRRELIASTRAITGPLSA